MSVDTCELCGHSGYEHAAANRRAWCQHRDEGGEPCDCPDFVAPSSAP